MPFFGAMGLASGIRRDSHFASVTSLMHMDDASFTDQKGLSWTAASGASRSTSIKKFGSSSLALDGSATAALNGPTGAATQFSGDFTVEGWIYYTSANQAFVFDTRASGGVAHTGLGLWLRGSDSHLNVDDEAGTLLTSTATVSSSTWTAFAITRSGSTLRLFVGGTLDVSATYSNNLSAGRYCIGNRTSDQGQSATFAWTGNIDEMRVTNGYCRYTSTYTPSSAAFPNS